MTSQDHSSDQEETPEVHDGADDSSGLLNGGGKVDRESLDALYNACDEADAESQARVRFVLAKDLQKRLDRYLVDRVPFLSRTSLQKLIGEDGVTVNGRRAKA